MDGAPTATQSLAGLGVIRGIVGQSEEGGVKREKRWEGDREQDLGTAVTLSQLLWCPGGMADRGAKVVRTQRSQVESGREEPPQRLCPDLRLLPVQDA